MQRIAILRLSSLGDIVLTSPAVSGLRDKYPDAELVFITTPPYRDLAAAIPGINRVIAVDKHGINFENALRDISKEKWFGAADLHGSKRSRRIVQAMNPEIKSEYNPPRIYRTLQLITRKRFDKSLPVPERYLLSLKPFGVVDKGQGLELDINAEIQDSLLAKLPSDLDNFVVIVPGAQHGTKCWPGQYWLELCEELLKENNVIISGVKGEVPVELEKLIEVKNNLYDLTGKLSIIETAALIKNASFVIGGDTGPMHIAVAVKTPSIVIFGPTVREFGFFPFRTEINNVIEVASDNIYTQENLFCRPCTAHGSKNCPLFHFNCMRKITPENILQAYTHNSAIF